MCTANFILDDTHFDYHQILHLLISKCNNQYSTSVKNGITTYKFNLRNYTLYLTPKYLTGYGSLSKFYQGNNLQNIDYKTTIKALGLLEQEVGTSLKNARIKRIDFAINILTNLPVRNYLDIICTPNKYKDFKVQGETRDFRKGKKVSLILYDKGNEPFTKKYLKMNKIEYLNCLRIESRLMSKPEEIFGLKTLRYRDLYKIETYNTLLNYWYEQYLLAPHVTNIVQTPICYDNKTAFVDSLAIIALKALGGIELVEEQVQSIKGCRVARHKIREYLRGLKMIVKSPFDLSVELNNKVEEVYQYYLAK